MSHHLSYDAWHQTSCNGADLLYRIRHILMLHHISQHMAEAQQQQYKTPTPPSTHTSITATSTHLDYGHAYTPRLRPRVHTSTTATRTHLDYGHAYTPRLRPRVLTSTTARHTPRIRLGTHLNYIQIHHSNEARYTTQQ